MFLFYAHRTTLSRQFRRLGDPGPAGPSPEKRPMAKESTYSAILGKAQRFHTSMETAVSQIPHLEAGRGRLGERLGVAQDLAKQAELGQLLGPDAEVLPDTLAQHRRQQLH